MAGRVRFVCLLHSHQPVGNFDHVIEEAYCKSYLPYVEEFERFPNLPLTHHLSGCLLEWLEVHHPEYLARLREQVSGKKGRAWEMIGGGMQEPITTILPERDRLGQIRALADFIESRFGVRPRGLWLTERVWEPALVKDLAEAGVRCLTLDDSHFKAAGLTDEQLVGGFLTEDQGRTVVVYPASEKLRYLIPFAPPEKAIEYLRALVPAEGERVVCYADDGEKFGVWPHTYQTVFEEGWLRKFLQALSAAQEEGWLRCSTLSETLDEVAVGGPIYLPENSYREMTEWALPARRLATYERAREELQDNPRARELLPLVRGGSWRSFRAKYLEAGKMYAKMMEVSAAVAALPPRSKRAAAARTHLYRGQCNCAYWHGVFGGLYLPHLRSAVYRELLRAETTGEGRNGSAAGAKVVVRDFDFDGADEIKLAGPALSLYLHPRRGGHLYEFDVRRAAFNVCDTFSRRYEAYHEKAVRATVGGGPAGTIHEVMPAKEKGLAKLLRYDAYPRESLVDHVSPRRLTPDDFLSGRPPSRPEFRTGEYEAETFREGSRGRGRGGAGKKNGAEVGVRLRRRAALDADREIEIRKQISLGKNEVFRAAYAVENRGPRPAKFFFAVEMNYGLLAGNAPDRYYYREKAPNAGPLETTAEFGRIAFVGLKDHWLDLDLTLHASPAAEVAVCPVKTVSSSESGFESVFQSSTVVLQWALNLEVGRSFELELRQEVGRA